jgi:hypothetical protein
LGDNKQPKSDSRASIHAIKTRLPKNMKTSILSIFSILGISMSAFAAIPAVLTGPILNPANNHHYYLLDTETWTSSQSKAVSLGGNLVTINNAAENAWVSATFQNFGGVTRDLWTGLNDATTEGTFQWASGEALSFSNWQSFQPDNGGADEDYVHMWGGNTFHSGFGWQIGGWNDYENLSSYGSGSVPPVRSIFGVVEVVPEPTMNTLLLVSASVLSWLRCRKSRTVAPASVDA